MQTYTQAHLSSKAIKKKVPSKKSLLLCYDCKALLSLCSKFIDTATQV